MIISFLIATLKQRYGQLNETTLKRVFSRLLAIPASYSRSFLFESRSDNGLLDSDYYRFSLVTPKMHSALFLTLLNSLFVIGKEFLFRCSIMFVINTFRQILFVK
jgi:hypothetical protein